MLANWDHEREVCVWTKTVELPSGSFVLPCSLDLDLTLESRGLFYWAPDIVQMQAQDLTVAGAC